MRVLPMGFSRGLHLHEGENGYDYGINLGIDLDTFGVPKEASELLLISLSAY